MAWLCVLVVVAALAFFGRDALRTLFAPRPQGAAPRRRAVADSLPGLSAQWLLAECARLAAARAAWPETAAALNPGADAEVDSLLARLRAAGMGEVPTILKAIEDGCRDALEDNAEAGAFDALTVAARKSPWTSAAKW